jgi:hypothetical protein
LQLLEENIGKVLQDFGTGNNFLNRTIMAQEIKARIDLHQILKLLLSKENTQQSEETNYRMG